MLKIKIKRSKTENVCDLHNPNHNSWEQIDATIVSLVTLVPNMYRISHKKVSYTHLCELNLKLTLTR